MNSHYQTFTSLVCDFYLCSIGTTLAYEITHTEWLKVPNSHYRCS